MTARQHAWLWLLVAVQVAIPAAYYLRPGTRDDERFAWRMFSAVRVKRCSVRLAERREAGLEQVPLESFLHSSWQHQLERGRPRVITRVLEQRCARPGTDAAQLERRCRDAKGAKLPVERFELRCGAQQLTREVLP